MAQQTDHIPDVRKKLTAVEFIRTELQRLGILDKGEVMTRIFEQAKQMEKEQIIDAYTIGSYDMAEKEFRPEQYYNETYQ